MSRITSSSTVREVQDIMNAASVPLGSQKLWDGRNPVWNNLLDLRNGFIEERLADRGTSVKSLKDLKKQDRRLIKSQLVDNFTNNFFDYSRKEAWMQAAVGKDGHWITIKGMADWHVNSAISALEARVDTAAEPLLETPTTPYDPVKDAAKDYN